MLRSSVIIPTYHRPKELDGCIRSILEQSTKPDELIIVDDGDLGALPWKGECDLANIAVIYFKKAFPGLTESRNKGVTLASGEVIFFLDDDVVLYPNYFEEIIRVYEADVEAEVGGVGGYAVNEKPRKLSHRLRGIFERFFLMSGFQEGKILRSGFCTEFGSTGSPMREAQEVDFLSGGVSSFRKEVFESFSFTDKYRNYGFGEDKDFSCQVAKKYKLVVNPRARLLHLESPKMRPDKAEIGRKTIIAWYLLFDNYVKKSRWSWLFFYYALFGYVLLRVVILTISFDKREFDRLEGIFHAVKQIFRKQIRME